MDADNTIPSPVFVTETMGELLVSQGFLSRAVEVYDELVRRRPYDPVLTSRLAELRERLVAESIAPDAVPPQSDEQQVDMQQHDAQPVDMEPVDTSKATWSKATWSKARRSSATRMNRVHQQHDGGSEAEYHEDQTSGAQEHEAADIVAADIFARTAQQQGSTEALTSRRLCQRRRGRVDVTPAVRTARGASCSAPHASSRVHAIQDRGTVRTREPVRQFRDVE